MVRLHFLVVGQYMIEFGGDIMVLDFDVEIEATNQCNTRCLHCPHESLSRPMGKMDWETYQKIIDKIIRYTDQKGFSVSVDFAGMGEPLLNPLIYQFISYISDKTFTAITTNGSALTERNITRLIEAGLNLLIVSFNGADRITYELMMGGLSFERAVQHLRKALELTNGTKTNIAVNLSITKQTQRKLKQIIKFLDQLGIDNISFSKCHNRGGYLNSPDVCDTPMPPPHLNSRCDIFKQTLFVAWNGDVLSCCHDLGGENVLGNLVSDSLDEIITTKQEIEKNGLSFRICGMCNDLYRFRSDLEAIPLGELIYELYATEPDITYPGLLQWLFKIYAQEDKLQIFIQNLWSSIDKKQKLLISNRNKIELLEKQIQLLSAEIASIKESETWQIAINIQNFKSRLIPNGSLSDKIAKKIYKLLG